MSEEKTPVPLGTHFQIACHRILQAITPQKGAWYVTAAAAGLGLSQVFGLPVPAELIPFATVLGAEALGSLLSDLSQGRDISNEEIVARVESALAKANQQTLGPTPAGAANIVGT